MPRGQGRAGLSGNNTGVVRTPTPPQDRSRAASIGATLRSARGARGISLDELHARTKISVAHLAALEEGRLDALPPLAFSRGFLRTVARELGVDPEPLVRDLVAIMPAADAEPAEAMQRLGSPIVQGTAASPLRRRITFLAILVILVLTSAVALLTRQIWEFAQPVPAKGPPSATATPEAAVPSPAPLPSQVPAPREERVPPGAPRTREDVTIEVRASGRSWLLVRTGENRLFEGFISAGQVMRWVSPAQITLRAGNAGALTVIANGNALGVYGRLGEVVERTFRPGAAP